MSWNTENKLLKNLCLFVLTSALSCLWLMGCGLAGVIKIDPTKKKVDDLKSNKIADGVVAKPTTQIVLGALLLDSSDALEVKHAEQCKRGCAIGNDNDHLFYMAQINLKSRSVVRAKALAIVKSRPKNDLEYANACYMMARLAALSIRDKKAWLTKTIECEGVRQLPAEYSAALVERAVLNHECGDKAAACADFWQAIEFCCHFVQREGWDDRSIFMVQLIRYGFSRGLDVNKGKVVSGLNSCQKNKDGEGRFLKEILAPFDEKEADFIDQYFEESLSGGNVNFLDEEVRARYIKLLK